MKAICGCGRYMGDFGGVPGTAYMECPECVANDGVYTKSSKWNHERDKADADKVRQGQAYNQAMQNVKPLKRDRRKAA